MQKIITALFIALTLALAQPLAAQESDGETLEWSGAHSSRAEYSVVVARGEEAWRELWAGLSKSPPVALDSDSQIAIAVFLGMRRTGGFAVEITAVEDGPVFYTVDVGEIKPAPGAMVTQALTAPYVIRILPHSDRPLMFRWADAASGQVHTTEAELEITAAWVTDLWQALQEARQENQQLKYIVDEAERQIEQLHRELRERCDPCGVTPN
ncbi:MAG: protease complex subunit PrcB family protein [Alphaproteobacteria bacterium]|jgi:hypothetical protein|nr:protease complex subunit PrcB family protein [Alphaproteobacteria bacterium]MDP6589604.1 protease complex subunit PrcB family protein [Alphaproteobacteria bacterium]MDP6819069.1 protease complex subunit PrcB family protein [Alphaproteobacteria bacterium]